MGRWDGIDEFVAVAESASFSQAARRLGSSTSSVSREIARLEDRLQARLFYRTTRRVTLTEAGTLMLDRCRRLIQDREEALAEVSDADTILKGRLRITCSVGYGERFMVPAINRFALTHPQLTIETHLTDVVVDVVQDGFDLAVRSGRLNDSSLVARRIASRTRRLCAAPGYLKLHGAPTSLQDLSHHTCIVGAGDVWRFGLDRSEVQIRPQGRFRYTTGFGVLQAALDGLGLCQLPDFYVDDAIAGGKLMELLPGHLPPDEGVWAVYPHRRHLPTKVRLLVDHLEQSIRAGRAV